MQTNRQLRTRRALSIFKDVLLRTRSALSLYKVYGTSALLVLNRTSLNSDSALLALNTLLKSDVTTRDHVVRCCGSQECGSRNVNFACKFHRRSHRVRITQKSTSLQHCCSCAEGMCEPRNRDNGASDLWTLTAY